MTATVLPWKQGERPLMLAPMQGLTNGVLRRHFIEQYRPDLVFTEFVRVQTQTRKRVARADLADISEHPDAVPLVVQLIGNDARALSEAAQIVQSARVRHLNLNLGCPYGRMTTGATGGELLREPLRLRSLLTELRRVCTGSFSIKCRAGYDSLDQWRELLPLYEDCGIDFLILHPRTVKQYYSGMADHSVTAAVAEVSSLPVIANGDINDAATAHRLLSQTAIAGLMVGRGALADPWLFCRIRGDRPADIDRLQRRRELGAFIRGLLPGYLERFCGERQALMKIKDILNFMSDPELQPDLRQLKRATSLNQFNCRLEQFTSPSG